MCQLLELYVYVYSDYVRQINQVAISRIYKMFNPCSKQGRPELQYMLGVFEDRKVINTICVRLRFHDTPVRVLL